MTDTMCELISSIIVTNTSNNSLPILYSLYSNYGFYWTPATAQFPPQKFSSSGNNTEEGSAEPRKIVLSSKDELFAQLRDKNFNAVGPALKIKARQITEQFEVHVFFVHDMLGYFNIHLLMNIISSSNIGNQKKA